MMTHAPDTFVSHKEAQAVPREQLLVVATGSQGEPGAALGRLANDTHPRLSLEEGDEVVLSSRVIPGREREIVKMVNALERKGVRVFSRRDDPALHVSGHAHRDEQRRLIELVRPRAFVPVHGTLVHLKRHAELARGLGVGDVSVVENGVRLELGNEHGLRRAGQVPTGRVHRQASTVVAEQVLKERGRLSSQGLLSIVVVLDAQGVPVGQPEIALLGLLDEERGEALSLLPRLRRAVVDAIAECRDPDGAELEAAVARAARRVLRGATGQRPMVQSVVVRAPAASAL